MVDIEIELNDFNMVQDDKKSSEEIRVISDIEMSNYVEAIPNKTHMIATIPPSTSLADSMADKNRFEDRHPCIFITLIIIIILLMIVTGATLIIGYPAAAISYVESEYPNSCDQAVINGCLSHCSCSWCYMVNTTQGFCTKSDHIGRCDGMDIKKAPTCDKDPYGFEVVSIMVGSFVGVILLLSIITCAVYYKYEMKKDFETIGV
jgi:hypothetical protein